MEAFEGDGSGSTPLLGNYGGCLWKHSKRLADAATGTKKTIKSSNKSFSLPYFTNIIIDAYPY